jgi:hypothetical protein
MAPQKERMKMARRANYGFEKRQKEIKKQQKKDAKLEKKQQKKEEAANVEGTDEHTDVTASTDAHEND